MIATSHAVFSKNWEQTSRQDIPSSTRLALVLGFILVTVRSYKQPATIQVINDDTRNAAIELCHRVQADAGPKSQPPIVVNFANRHSPGGGWLNGAIAQEEALRYRSTLALSLNKKHYPVERDDALYSPYALIMRDDLSSGHEMSSLPARELPAVSALTVGALRGPPVRFFTNEPRKGIDVPDSLTSTASQENEASASISVDSEFSSHDTGHAVIQSGSNTVSVGSTDALFSESFTSSSTAITLTSITITSASTTVTSVSAAITLDTATVTEATTTPNGVIVPAGRSIILQVNLDSNNRGRYLVRRTLGGFVSPADTDICTFASLFNLAQGQLFSNDFPIYYTSGDDYKELVGVDQPSRGSISTGFAASGGSLVFRNIGLPNGEAQFCQTSDSRVYVVFTDGPPGCVPVTLSVYESSQCQNGQLVGVGETTTAFGTSASQAVSFGSDTSITSYKTEDSTISPETSSSIVSSPSYITQSESGDLPITVSKTEESTGYPTTIPGTLLPSSRVTESESVVLQTSGTKAPPDASSRTSHDTLLSSATANAPTLEASTSNILSATGTDGASSTDSVLTGVVTRGTTSQSSLNLSDLPATSTVVSETDSTPTAPKTTNTGNASTRDSTFDTGSTVDTASADNTTTEVTTRADTTSKTEAGASTTDTDTTANETISTQSSTTELFSSGTTTTEEDNTTLESIPTQKTTTEPSSSDTTTTAEDTTSSNESPTTTDETTTTPQDPTTTTADPTTTTRPYRSCDDLKPRYAISDADKFDIFCTNDVTQGTYSDSSFAWDFQECMDRCFAQGDVCRAITYERAISICKLYTSTDGHEFSQDIDYAEKDFCC
ncbi:uncharacterized protein FSUBG_13223 [Fusarium subglutinans]|uniref:Apple domain-containing protein n=1 Tax=Gibberella subglutinans TaxID=42677 RepID=A0A8H5NYB2_GIBSU|nr:uncharacterized protein FSUBG_13223 [Fusarium subglutinans]KAF5583102.1 hypothetical protein FSUBG_13223 [Fusarium subglutinans]